MGIIYDDIIKDLPIEQLYYLFQTVGWSNGLPNLDMLQNFNIPFINSTLVISAWENNRLIGAVRVLSDKMFRSVIYDLLVDPEFQNKGIGKELVRRCIEHYPNSNWLVQTQKHIAGFYEKLGFKINNDVFLHVPNEWASEKTDVPFNV